MCLGFLIAVVSFLNKIVASMFLDEMLICNENFDVEILKNHNQYHHSVNKNNYFFKELFLPDDIRQNCDMCYIHFKNCRQRINHNFLFYRNQQIGVRLNQSHPRNVLRGGPIIYY